MNARVNLASLGSLISVIALYIETILQIVVTVTSENTSIVSTPIAMTSLCTMGISFVSSSIASFEMARSSVQLDDDTLKTKVIFRFLHFFQFGLVWRTSRLILSFSGSDAICLSNLRLIHVAIQSLPYMVIYSTTFVIKGKINALQTLSLICSGISSVLAVSYYILRLRLWVDETQEEDTKTVKHPSSFKSLCAVLATFVGTLLVLFARSASITLVAAQVRLWVFLPLSFHFLLMFIVYLVFSPRVQKEKPRILTFPKHFVYCAGMSILNSFDLVHDNIAHVMCKYVAFYSLLLIENIIFVSFWLLNFDLGYVSKLVTVLGILFGYIVGLIIKFAGCTLLHRDVTKSESDEDLSQVTHGMPPIAATPISGTLSLTSAKLDDDLVSIVQASLAHHAHLSERVPPQTPSNQVIQLSTGPKARRKKSSARSKRRQQIDKIITKNPTTTNGSQNNSTDRLPHSVQNHASHDSIHRAVTLRPEKSERLNLSDAVDQNDSFQQSSVFSVSDPETLLSDMMYDEVGADGCQQRTDSFNQSIEHKQFKGIHRKELESSKSSTPREINHPESSFSHNHQSFQSQYEVTAKKSRSSKVLNMASVSKGGDSGKTKRRYVQNQPQDITHPNESSDTAMSSARTYPCEPKKGNGISSRNPKFDEKMKIILSSIEDRNKQTSDDELTLPYRFSDSEAVTKSRATRLHSVNSKDRRMCKNIITYTENDDVITHENQIGHKSKDKENIQGQHCNVSKSMDTAPPGRVLSSNVTQLCESGSSSFTTTMSNGNMTQTRSSSSTTMTTEDCWQDERAQSSDAKSDRLSQFILQSDVSRISPSENILRWLSTTSSNAETD